jgi:hypothetical protein
MTINFMVEKFMQGESVTQQGSQGGIGIPDAGFVGVDMPGKSLNEQSGIQ